MVMNCNDLRKLGPVWPWADGPRMDHRVVTSLGVVKISRLASKTVTHSLPRGCGPKRLLTRGPKRPFRCLEERNTVWC